MRFPSEKEDKAVILANKMFLAGQPLDVHSLLLLTKNSHRHPNSFKNIFL